MHHFTLRTGIISAIFQQSCTEMWMLPRRQLCFQEYLQLEIFVPGALSYSLSLSGKWASMRVHTHTSFSPLLKKWIMAEDYEYLKSTNSLTEKPLAQPASEGSTSRGKWTMKSHFRNFSLVRHLPSSHPPPHTHPLSSPAGLNTSISTTSSESFLQDHISHILIIRDGVLLQSGFTFWATSSQSGV